MGLPRSIVILGPTAGGKSTLAVSLAEQLGGEILSADSMQIYRHMDAGTAKPSAAMRHRVPHHLIDVVEPTDRFTVADWLQRADPLIENLAEAGKRPIIVGGTNLYIKALLEGMFDGPTMDPGLRTQLEGETTETLQERLGKVDPESTARIHRNDRRRLIRALEVYELSGQPISRWQTQWNKGHDAGRDQSPGLHGPANNPLLIGLRWSTETINQRINFRVKAMFHPSKFDPEVLNELNIRQSLPDEVRQLTERSMMGPQSSEAIGYKQVIMYFKSRISLDEAFEQTKIQTRRFARQQRTWLRRFPNIHWIEVSDLPSDQVFTAAISIVNN